MPERGRPDTASALVKVGIQVGIQGNCVVMSKKEFAIAVSRSEIPPSMTSVRQVATVC